MKYTALFLGFFLLLTPNFAGAQTSSCSEKGYTVVFVNGIFGTYQQALDASTALNQKIGFQYQGEPLKVQLGYNPTHLAGAADLLQSTAEMYGKSISNFDLDTILLDIYPKVTTRKLILIGHSQGAFYTNDLYHYLVSNGESADAVGVYNVGSPASYTAGHGKYINSSNDTLLAFLRTLNFDILPSNANLQVDTKNSDWNGHSFTEDYLGEGGEQIQSDIDSEMSALSATNATETGDCFTPPNKTVAYKAQAAAFAVADPTATVLKAGTVAIVKTGAIAFNAATKLATGALQFFSDAIVITTAPPSDAQKDADTEKIANKLYGSSLDDLSAKDKKELLGTSQGGAVALAIPQKPVVKGIVLGTSTEATSTPPVPKNIFPDSSNGPVISGGGGGASDQPIVTVPTTVEVVPVVEDTPDTTPPIVDTPPVEDTTASTTPEEVPEQVPPPPLYSETFDTYDTSGWSTIFNNSNHTYTQFPFDDGSTGDCHSGGCINSSNSGSGGLGGGGHVDYMFKDTGVGGLSGAYTVWGRARIGGHGVSDMIGVCTSMSSGCGGSDSLIVLQNILLTDDAWHQYYLAWRQGSTAVEYCFMHDDTDSNNCDWQLTDFPLGTEFNAIQLNGFSEYYDKGDEVWFDDLAAATQ